jgi:hypothetical protein
MGVEVVVDGGDQIYGQVEEYYVALYEQVMRVSHDAGDGVDGMVNHPVAPMDWMPLD